MSGILSGALSADAAALRRKMNDSPDLVERAFKTGGLPAVLFYMSGVTDTAQIQLALARLMNFPPEESPAKKDGVKFIDRLLDGFLPVAELTLENDINKIAEALVYGDGILLIDGEKKCVQCAFKKWDTRGIAEPPNSAVIRGPREGFIEDMKVNTGLLRRRLRTENLIFETLKIGRYSNTAVTVAYIRGIADESLVAKITNRLRAVDIDGIIDSFYVQQFLEERKSGMFRQTGFCEKPDIAAAKMLEGRVAVFVDGSPAVLTLPYILFEDVQSAGDYYSRQPYNNLIIFLRLAALALSVLLPGLYVAAQVFHYGLLPLKTMLTLANSVQATPLPPVLEMLAVLALFITVYEASLRMPRYVGMSLSIVAALVLGDTAVKAGIISSFSVLISAVSAIAAHTVPDQADGASLLKIIFTLLGGLAGFFGIGLGLLFLTAYLASLDSYGAPYLAPFAPLIRADLKDGVFKTNIGGMKTRPESVPSVNKVRAK